MNSIAPFLIKSTMKVNLNNSKLEWVLAKLSLFEMIEHLDFGYVLKYSLENNLHPPISQYETYGTHFNTTDNIIFSPYIVYQSRLC